MIKVLCTTVGETAADLLNGNLGLGTSALFLAVILALVVYLTRSKRDVLPTGPETEVSPSAA
ncbi:hypothetical protein [Streptomyces sp. NPDC004296]|uniref:hypothetical protein n=1 Tax=Streptomyces sp. NPDC004296 TaxID=3364697 RepID=UPI0036B9B3DC